MLNGICSICQQIKDWLSNHAKKFNATTGGKQEGEIIKALGLEGVKQKAERAPHQIEVYLKLFPEKVEAEYLIELRRLEASTEMKIPAGALLQLRRTTAYQMLLKETPENKEKITDYIAQWREKHEDRLKHEDPTFVTPTPAAYQK